MKNDLTRREFVGQSVAAGLALASGVAAAAGEAPVRRDRRHEGVELTLLTNAGHAYFQAFARDFEAQTGAKVRVEGGGGPHDFDWWYLEPRVQADAVSRRPRYDLFCSDINHTWTLWPHLRPLDDLMRRSGYEIDGFFAGVRRYGELVRPGVRYGLPVRAMAPVVFYRRDLLGSLPATWEEYERALAAHTGAGRHGFAAVGLSYLYHPGGPAEELTKMYLARYWSLGDPILSADRQPLIGGEKGVAALEMLRRQVAAYVAPESVTWDAAAAAKEFVEGRAAVLEAVAGPELLRRLQDPAQSRVVDRWAVGPYPGPAGSFFTMGQEMMILKRTPHPEAAFDFIAFCTGPANAGRLLSEFGERSARTGPWLANPAVPPEQRRNIVATVDRGVMFAPGEPQWLDLLTALWDSVSPCLKGFLSPRQAMALAADKWRDALARRHYEIRPDA
ncbi:MAG: extracellular solute-binding protein [Opitutaceae bacterium]|nr:extracellular solute-binding protein [Opitutaceae bacterium]